MVMLPSTQAAAVAWRDVQALETKDLDETYVLWFHAVRYGPDPRFKDSAPSDLTR
jgi:hypothetical protein